MTQREEFERWFKYDFHPDKTGPYVKDQLWFAWQAAKSALLTLPDRMDYELHGDSVIDSHHNTFADGYNECLSDVIAMNEEYANSTGSDGWIPVSERLPESNTDLYLCSGHEGTKFVCYRRHNEWIRSPQMKRVVGITHWMPITPAPVQAKDI